MAKKVIDNLDDIEATFVAMDNDKGKVGLALLEEARFIKSTLERLKKEIQDNDMVGEMQQGSYSITRSNPALKTYNTTSDNYRKIMKQIIDLLPKEEKTKETGFDEF